MSVKQGKKFDDPASKAEIPKFIQFHRLDMSEVLRPLEDFKNFNEFFYRALKPGARPCSAPDHPGIVVSPADCRSVVFNSVDHATTVWIKGREFSVKRLLGDAYPEDAKRYENGALGIFRLAPQDYHRFHIPVDGRLDKPKLIAGEYYTVNPMAIRSALDVYGENVRVVCPIDSLKHGRVMVICVGAMMVGSTVITRNEGDEVKRAEELGYFKFGGSTIVLLFEEGKMRFDDDLTDNSAGALETLVSASRPKCTSARVVDCQLTRYARFARACPSVTRPTRRSGLLICARMTRTSRMPRRRRLSGASKAAWERNHRAEMRRRRHGRTCRQLRRPQCRAACVAGDGRHGAGAPASSTSHGPGIAVGGDDDLERFIDGEGIHKERKERERERERTNVFRPGALGAEWPAKDLSCLVFLSTQ